MELIAITSHDEDEHTTSEEKHSNEEHVEGDEGEKHEGHEENSHGHEHGDFDPHGWLSLQNAITYIDNITASLSKAAPARAATFYLNRETYITEIKSLDQQIKAMTTELTQNARTIVTSHDAFQYFGRDYGLSFLAPQGLSTESEASARKVAQLIKQIRADGIAAVHVENVADPRLLQQIATETGSIVGGKLYPGALSEHDGPAASYLDLMRHNATTIATALSGAKDR